MSKPWGGRKFIRLESALNHLLWKYKPIHFIRYEEQLIHNNLDISNRRSVRPKALCAYDIHLKAAEKTLKIWFVNTNGFLIVMICLVEVLAKTMWGLTIRAKNFSKTLFYFKRGGKTPIFINKLKILGMMPWVHYSTI